MDIVKFVSLPPVIFVLVSLVILIIFFLLGRLSYKSSAADTEGKLKSYACGEEPIEERRKPNYSQFFPFAFFFTIMHVVVLLIATLPIHIDGSLLIVLLFLIISFVSIPILFRDEK
ncbi:MAG: NADH-quinone oxidoreductase subunit A [Endomicrobiaceae bacterium]|jgi:NADH-quinone oxidoreductase subunit A|nr:NADH-quinone oxidoreductase subunit A [Endomicrobiaceae bacterium]